MRGEASCSHMLRCGLRQRTGLALAHFQRDWKTVVHKGNRLRHKSRLGFAISQALNTQFLTWVNTQSVMASSALWTAGVNDYLKHAEV